MQVNGAGFAGFAQSGNLVVCGDAGEALGDSLYDRVKSADSEKKWIINI